MTRPMTDLLDRLTSESASMVRAGGSTMTMDVCDVQLLIAEIKRLKALIEEVLSTDTDMPTYDDLMQRLEAEVPTESQDR